MSGIVNRKWKEKKEKNTVKKIPLLRMMKRKKRRYLSLMFREKKKKEDNNEKMKKAYKEIRGIDKMNAKHRRIQKWKNWREIKSKRATTLKRARKREGRGRGEEEADGGREGKRGRVNRGKERFKREGRWNEKTAKGKEQNQQGNC